MPAGFSESSPANRAWNLDPDLNPSQPLRLQRLVSRETIVPSGAPESFGNLEGRGSSGSAAEGVLGVYRVLGKVVCFKWNQSIS